MGGLVNGCLQGNGRPAIWKRLFTAILSCIDNSCVVMSACVVDTDKSLSGSALIAAFGEVRFRVQDTVTVTIEGMSKRNVYFFGVPVDAGIVGGSMLKTSGARGVLTLAEELDGGEQMR